MSRTLNYYTGAYEQRWLASLFLLIIVLDINMKYNSACLLPTGSIHTAQCRYFGHSLGNFGVFLPHRMTHCTDEGEISLNFTIFTPVGAGTGARTEKLKICNFRIPIGICLGRFNQILRVCRKLQFASIIEIWENSFEGFWIYGGFNLESAF